MEDLEKKPVETTETKVETEPVKEEVKAEEKVEVPTETKVEEPMEKTETEPQKEEVKEETEQPKEETKTEDQVEDTSESANGIRIEDIITRDEFTARLDALSAKIDAIIQENTELKDKLAQVKSKYEDDDFGANAKQGIPKTDKVANDTFAEYAKRFM